MPVASSVFLVLALILAVVLGPQTRPWSWGPAMLALGAGVLAALPVFWRKEKGLADAGMVLFGVITAAWFAWRASISPVWEYGEADLLLLASVVGAFIGLRAITGNPVAERILLWGIALTVIANATVIAQQLMEPGFTPVFRGREGYRMASGFFGHYIEAANYLAATSVVLLAAGLFGKHHWPTRWSFIITATAGFAALWFTRGRAGILGAAVALGALAVMALIAGKRREAKWFGPALIALPVMALGVAAFLYLGWQEAQQTRGGSGIDGLMDNNARLYFLGLALSCIGLHPVSGGGSRSFGWECFQFVDGKAQGDIIRNKPDLVHNEFMQAATDYGLVGFGLLMGLISTLVITCILRMCFEPRPKELDSRDAWRIGGMAALAGMLAQAFFGFVFHLIPGILLLGISLGMISRTSVKATRARVMGSGVLITAAGLVCFAGLIMMGGKGSLVLKTLWPVYFSKAAIPSAESQIEAYGKAIRIWPQSVFFQERGAIYQKLSDEGPDKDSEMNARLAIRDYLSAHKLHPYDPATLVNLANVHSNLGEDSEAENYFTRAIQLQGGMEPGFRSHFSFANHLHRKGLRLFDPSDSDPAHDAMEVAAEQMEIAVKKMHWVIGDMIQPRVSVHESLGTTRESVGDREGALQSYDFAASLQGGSRAHYRAGVLIGKMAVDDWSKRRAGEALYKFIEARRRVGLARNELPVGVTPSQSVEYIDYLDRTIAFLKGANVTPKE